MFRKLGAGLMEPPSISYQGLLMALLSKAYIIIVIRKRLTVITSPSDRPPFTISFRFNLFYYYFNSSPCCFEKPSTENLAARFSIFFFFFFFQLNGKIKIARKSHTHSRTRAVVRNREFPGPRFRCEMAKSIMAIWVVFIHGI